MASDVGQYLAQFGESLPAGGLPTGDAKPGASSGAGAPAKAPAAPAPAASPFASTIGVPNSAAGGPGVDDEPETENDAATVTVPKDVLDRVRSDPKAVLAESKPRAPTPAAGRPYEDIDDSAEPTKAVPREELLRGAANAKDGHVVIGADAGGEDATLAVAPGQNEANPRNLGAAIGETLQSNQGQGGFPPVASHPYQSVQGMGPASMGGHPGMGAPMGMGPGPGGPGMGGMGMPGQQQGQPWSSGHMPAAIPRQPGGVQSYPGGPMMQQGHPGAIPRTQAPTNWNPLQAPQPKSKISGQMILLVVVGFVCLAIFVTGIVLFATTKF